MSESEHESSGESTVTEYDETVDGTAVGEGVTADESAAEASFPIHEGAVVGLIAAIGTFLAHLLFTIVATAQAAPAAYSGGEDSTVVTDLVSVHDAAGWSYLSTFGVSFEADGSAATVGDATNHAAAGIAPPFTLGDTTLFLVSFGALILAGYAVARYTGADTPEDALKAGLSVVPAYVIVAIVSALLLTHTYHDPQLVETVVGNVAGLELETYATDAGEITGSVEFGASITSAAIFAGVVFPAIFAGLGALSTQRRELVDAALEKLA